MDLYVVWRSMSASWSATPRGRRLVAMKLAWTGHGAVHPG
jgi:hypothetical protein